jgi:hypothetical protein
LQELLAVTRESEEHFASIMLVMVLNNGSVRDGAVDQLDRTVMAKAQPLGKRSDRGPDAFGQTLDGEHQLVLLRIDTVITRRLLAEVQKLADTVAKFGDLAVLL